MFYLFRTCCFPHVVGIRLGLLCTFFVGIIHLVGEPPSPPPKEVLASFSNQETPHQKKANKEKNAFVTPQSVHKRIGPLEVVVVPLVLILGSHTMIPTWGSV